MSDFINTIISQFRRIHVLITDLIRFEGPKMFTILEWTVLLKMKRF